MDTVERRKLSYRIQVYLEDISHNASFFYYNSDFVLVANALSEEYLCNLVEKALKRGKRRMPGIGIVCRDREQMYRYFTALCKLSEGKSGSTNGCDTQKTGGKV